MKIRILGAVDVRRADELRALAGWNQTTREWELRRRLSPDGCFLAEWDGALVGTATTTCYDQQLAWIGMMLVHPGYRRLGIGAALFRQCLEHLQKVRRVVCIKLDATPLGQPLYARFGFSPELDLTRWQRAGAAPAAGHRAGSTPIPEPILQEIVKMDAAAFGCSRSELLKASLADLFAVVHRTDEGGVTGYGALRAGSRAYYLGPIVSPDRGTAEAIVRELLCHVGDGAVYWDLFDTNKTAVNLAQSLGFTAQRPLVRMCLGAKVAVARPEWQWGILDPATG